LYVKYLEDRIAFQIHSDNSNCPTFIATPPPQFEIEIIIYSYDVMMSEHFPDRARSLFGHREDSPPIGLNDSFVIITASHKHQKVLLL
jgi:hypothetical protein